MYSEISEYIGQAALEADSSPVVSRALSLCAKDQG